MSTDKKQQFITDSKGQKKAIILDYKIYNELLEDLQDLRTIADRKNEESISIKDAKRKLIRNGLLKC